jgi:hypothetical protein
MSGSRLAIAASSQPIPSGRVAKQRRAAQVQDGGEGEVSAQGQSVLPSVGK